MSLCLQEMINSLQTEAEAPSVANESSKNSSLADKLLSLKPSEVCACACVLASYASACVPKPRFACAWAKAAAAGERESGDGVEAEDGSHRGAWREAAHMMSETLMIIGRSSAPIPALRS